MADIDRSSRECQTVMTSTRRPVMRSVASSGKSAGLGPLRPDAMPTRRGTTERLVESADTPVPNTDLKARRGPTWPAASNRR